MPKFADLHIHTYFSDSTSSPQEVIDHARQAGLDCIAITDHDTMEGVEPTQQIARQHNIEVIAGIEMSSSIDDKDVHILGYGVNINDEHFNRQLCLIQETRVQRIKDMIEKLKKLGVGNITFEEVASLAKSNSLGRPHLASVLLQKGVVSNRSQAFKKYLAEGAPAYVSKFKLSPEEAIDLIKKSGGIAVLAHPMLTQVDTLIPDLAAAGLEGIEVFYPNTSESVMNYYQTIATKYNLICTGGSDAHGEAKTHTRVGKVKIPYELVDILKAKFRKK